MGNQVMSFTSNHYKTKLEELGMPKREFLKLLDLFVNENWQNHETYNNFIRGFGNNFDTFNKAESVRFI